MGFFFCLFYHVFLPDKVQDRQKQPEQASPQISCLPGRWVTSCAPKLLALKEAITTSTVPVHCPLTPVLESSAIFLAWIARSSCTKEGCFFFRTDNWKKKKDALRKKRVLIIRHLLHLFEFLFLLHSGECCCWLSFVGPEDTIQTETSPKHPTRDSLTSWPDRICRCVFIIIWWYI